MTTFALDCSQKNLTMALFEGSSLIASHDEDVGNSQSQKLLFGFDELLKSANKQVSDVDTVLYSTGPGSFTSLRIGLAFLKGVFDSQSIQFITFSSLRYRCLVLQKKSKIDHVCCGFSLGRGRFIVGEMNQNFYDQKLCDAEQWQILKSTLQSANVAISETEFKCDAEVLIQMKRPELSEMASLRDVQLEYVIPPDIG